MYIYIYTHINKIETSFMTPSFNEIFNASMDFLPHMRSSLVVFHHYIYIYIHIYDVYSHSSGKKVKYF